MGGGEERAIKFVIIWIPLEVKIKKVIIQSSLKIFIIQDESIKLARDAP